MLLIARGWDTLALAIAAFLEVADQAVVDGLSDPLVVVFLAKFLHISRVGHVTEL